MGTTISIKDGLLVEATAAAAQSGQSVDEFIEAAIRCHLDAATPLDPGQPSENYSPADDADALLEKMKFGLGVGG